MSRPLTRTRLPSGDDDAAADAPCVSPSLPSLPSPVSFSPTHLSDKPFRTLRIFRAHARRSLGSHKATFALHSPVTAISLRLQSTCPSANFNPRANQDSPFSRSPVLPFRIMLFSGKKSEGTHYLALRPSLLVSFSTFSLHV